MIIVAEIGLNHDGNFDLIYEMMKQAKQAGADLVKFQFGWRSKPEEINHLDSEGVNKLKAWGEYLDIEIFASIFTEEALELAHAIGMKRYKIAARTVVDDFPLCERIISEGKPTYVSLGRWDKQGWPFGAPADNLHYIYCRSIYPTPPSELRDMPPSFNLDGYYGYSDHLQGIEGCLLAIARGAKYIEKHFTLNKTSQVIRDHVLSATPEEFRQLTEAGRPLARLVSAIAV